MRRGESLSKSSNLRRIVVVNLLQMISHYSYVNPLNYSLLFKNINSGLLLSIQQLFHKFLICCYMLLILLGK